MGVYAGTSSTAPTDKTAYAWVKYIGEDGNGAGDMLASVYATNGTTGVVDTSNRLRKYSVTSSGASNSGKWTKIAGVTVSGKYSGYHILLSVSSGVSTSEGYILDIGFRTSESTTVIDSASSHINAMRTGKRNQNTALGFSLAKSFKLVYTAPLFELWFNPSSSHLWPFITVINEQKTGTSPNLTWLENQPYQATQPAGTVVTATLMEDYLITDLTAETAIADTDYFMMHDTSAVANRKTLWSSIKSTLETYFDTLYNKTASTTVKGGSKVGDGLTISNEVLSANVKGLINNKTDFDAQTVSTSQAVDSLLVKELLEDMSGIALTGTLAIGATSITFTDDMIVTGNTIKCDYYTDVYGVSPSDVTISTGSMTLTFSAQTVAVGVRVEIREV